MATVRGGGYPVGGINPRPGRTTAAEDGRDMRDMRHREAANPTLPAPEPRCARPRVAGAPLG